MVKFDGQKGPLPALISTATGAAILHILSSVP